MARRSSGGAARDVEVTMAKIKTIKDVPLFPLVPIIPAALLIGSLVTAVRALIRVRRLERQLTAAALG
jgi:hypothetical protein